MQFADMEEEEGEIGGRMLSGPPLNWKGHLGSGDKWEWILKGNTRHLTRQISKYAKIDAAGNYYTIEGMGLSIRYSL